MVFADIIARTCVVAARSRAASRTSSSSFIFRSNFSQEAQTNDPDSQKVSANSFSSKLVTTKLVFYHGNLNVLYIWLYIKEVKEH